jgi:hypothetical protein
VQRLEPRIGAAQRMRADVLQDVPAPFGEVLDAGAHPARMDGEAQHVHRGLEQLGRRAGGQHVDRLLDRAHRGEAAWELISETQGRFDNHYVDSPIWREARSAGRTACSLAMVVIPHAREESRAR